MQKAIDNIRNDLKSYILSNGIESLVIGVSGGIDSTLCCALARTVCNELHIPLIGRSLPIESNKSDEIQRAKLTGEYFCHDFEEIDLTEFYKASLPYLIEGRPKNRPIKCYNKFPLDIETKIRLGNIKARIRMIKLFDLSSEYKGMTLSTDNYTEYLLGFWTINGDVGIYGMIQNLWKTEVYEMSNFFAQELAGSKGADIINECIKAVPTDGLGISNSDLEQIGAKTYQEVDDILKSWLYNQPASLKDHPVIQRHIRSEFKRKIPINIPRDKIFKN